jgi:hypothetical protein
MPRVRAASSCEGRRLPFSPAAKVECCPLAWAAGRPGRWRAGEQADRGARGRADSRQPARLAHQQLESSQQRPAPPHEGPQAAAAARSGSGTACTRRRSTGPLHPAWERAPRCPRLPPSHFRSASHGRAPQVAAVPRSRLLLPLRSGVPLSPRACCRRRQRPPALDCSCDRTQAAPAGTVPALNSGQSWLMTSTTTGGTQPHTSGARTQLGTRRAGAPASRRMRSSRSRCQCCMRHDRPREEARPQSRACILAPAA